MWIIILLKTQHRPIIILFSFCLFFAEATHFCCSVFIPITANCPAAKGFCKVSGPQHHLFFHHTKP